MALQGERGDKTDGLSHKRAEAIHDSSPKANAELEKGREPKFQLRLPSSSLQGERGDKTDGLSHKRAEAIHDSSPKANAELEKGREPKFQLRLPSS